MENKKTFNENDNKETKLSSSSKNFLPPKKRFIHFEECNNSEETTKVKVEKKNPFDLIQAGVIRHTSCPDHSFAYLISPDLKIEKVLESGLI